MFALLCVGLAIGGCATTATQSHIASGEVPLCAGSRSLGRIAVLAETAWRHDQKDVEERQSMAANAIAHAFKRSGCGEWVDVRSISAWASRLEQERLTDLAEAGFTTVVFLRIEELGPTLSITFSLPFLWSGSSDAEFRLRAIQIEDATVLLDTAVKRTRFGPFHLRPPSWAEAELEAALVELLRGDAIFRGKAGR